MAVREVLVVNHPVLREKAREVKKITREVKALCRDMLETMHAAPGVGLAANQVGALHRVVVIELPEEEDEPLSGRPFCLINPEIVETSGSQIGQEGCLSVPGYVGEVERFETVSVKALSINGRPVNLNARGFLAKVLQHEIDHLDGVLYIDRLTGPDRLYRVEEGTEEEHEM
jgi:peptide deformylase